MGSSYFLTEAEGSNKYITAVLTSHTLMYAIKQTWWSLSKHQAWSVSYLLSVAACCVWIRPWAGLHSPEKYNHTVRQAREFLLEEIPLEVTFPGHFLLLLQYEWPSLPSPPCFGRVISNSCISHFAHLPRIAFMFIPFPPPEVWVKDMPSMARTNLSNNLLHISCKLWLIYRPCMLKHSKLSGFTGRERREILSGHLDFLLSHSFPCLFYDCKISH